MELALAQRAHDERGVVWDDARLTLAFPILLRSEVYAVVTITSAPPLYRYELIEDMARRIAEQLARVAEREQAQAEVARARDEAMEASRQKSDFLATMSHEIRTPLNGVIGLNDLLLRTSLTPEQHRLSSGVHGAGRTLLGLINDILDFSKIEAGRLELERVDFDVRLLLEQVSAMLAELAREKRLDLVVSCHPDVPAVLSGDPTRLAQVITNLVANAVKFTEHGVVAAPRHGRARRRPRAAARRSDRHRCRACRVRSRPTSSNPSPRATPPRPASTAAPGSASPSRASWWTRWAAPWSTPRTPAAAASSPARSPWTAGPGRQRSTRTTSGPASCCMAGGRWWSPTSRTARSWPSSWPGGASESDHVATAADGHPLLDDGAYDVVLVDGPDPGTLGEVGTRRRTRRAAPGRRPAVRIAAAAGRRGH